MYSVVYFDDLLELVPTKWLTHDNKSYYPTYRSRSKIENAIRLMENPQPFWKKYTIKQVFGTAATYEQGIQMLKVATKVSEIKIEYEENIEEEQRYEETSEETEGESVAKKQKRTHENDSSSDDEYTPSLNSPELRLPSHRNQSTNTCSTPESDSSLHSSREERSDDDEDKKLMETAIDELSSKKIRLDDLPLVQALTKRGNKAAVDKESSNLSLPLKHRSVTVKREENTDFFENLRKKMHSYKENAYNVKCDCKDLKEKLKEKNETIDRLKAEIEKGERCFHEMENKYREMKQKYKEKKKELTEYRRGNFKQEEDTNEYKKFGKISVPLSKLSLCRATAYSKYVGDLLEVCFGRETLAESVLKGPTNRSHKNNILDVDVINDIMINVMEKFPLVSVGMLRAAIRQKLNTCHKSKVKEILKNV